MTRNHGYLSAALLAGLAAGSHVADTPTMPNYGGLPSDYFGGGRQKRYPRAQRKSGAAAIKRAARKARNVARHKRRRA